jgi:hypothetical protein
MIKKKKIERIKNKIEKKNKLIKLKSKRIRIGTFNIENLFGRYKFNKFQKTQCPEKGFRISDLSQKFKLFDTESKEISVKAIIECNCDVICLQGNLILLNFQKLNHYNY